MLNLTWWKGLSMEEKCCEIQGAGAQRFANYILFIVYLGFFTSLFFYFAIKLLYKIRRLKEGRSKENGINGTSSQGTNGGFESVIDDRNFERATLAAATAFGGFHNGIRGGGITLPKILNYEENGKDNKSDKVVKDENTLS